MLETERAAFAAMAEGPGGAAMLQLGRGIIQGGRPNIFKSNLRNPLIEANRAVEAAFGPTAEATSLAQRSFAVTPEGWRPPGGNLPAPLPVQPWIAATRLVDALKFGASSGAIMPGSYQRPTGPSATREHWVPGMPSDELAYSVQQGELAQAGWGETRITNQVYMGLARSNPSFVEALRQQQYLLKKIPLTSTRELNLVPSAAGEGAMTRNALSQKIEWRALKAREMDSANPLTPAEIARVAELDRTFAPDSVRPAGVIPAGDAGNAIDIEKRLAGAQSTEAVTAGPIRSTAEQTIQSLADEPTIQQRFPPLNNFTRGGPPDPADPTVVVSRREVTRVSAARGQVDPASSAASRAIARESARFSGAGPGSGFGGAGGPPEIPPVAGVSMGPEPDPQHLFWHTTGESPATPVSAETQQYTAYGATAAARSVAPVTLGQRLAQIRATRDVALRGPGPGGMRQSIMNMAAAAQTVDLRPGAGYGSPVNTSIPGETYTVNEVNERLLSPTQVQEARNRATSAIGAQSDVAFRGTGEVTMDTVRSRVTSGLREILKGELTKVNEAVKRGMGEGQAIEWRDIAKAKDALASTVAKGVMDRASDMLGVDRNVSGAGRQINAGEFGQLILRDPAVRAQFEQAVAGGESWETQVAKGGSYRGAGGQIYNLPEGGMASGSMGGGYGTGIPGGPGGGGRGRGGNVLGRMGGAGQLLYGAYIAKRFWTMTAQPTLMAMEEFQQTQMASMASIGMDVSGTSASLAMQAQFQRGQGAQQVFGGIQDIFSRAGIDNPVLNRLSAVATVGGGAMLVGSIMGAAAGGSVMAANMLGMFGIGTGAAAVLGPAALAIGGTVIGAQMGLEAMNLASPGIAPSGIGQIFEKGSAEAYRQHIENQVYASLSAKPGQEPAYESFDWRVIGKTKEEQARLGIAARMASTLGTKVEQQLPYISAATSLGLGETTATTMAQAAAGQGIDPGSALTRSASFAQNMGYGIGTEAFKFNAWAYNQAPLAEKARMDKRAAVFGGQIGQLESVFGPQEPGAFNEFLYGVAPGIERQRAVGNMMALGQMGIESEAAEIIATSMSQFSIGQQQSYLNVGAYLTQQGVTPQAAQAMVQVQQTMGLSVDQSTLLSGVVQGDPRAMSYASRTGQFGVGSMGAFYNQAGQPIFTGGIGGGSGQQFLQMLYGQAGAGNEVANKLLYRSGQGGWPAPVSAQGVQGIVKYMSGYDLSSADAQSVFDMGTGPLIRDTQTEIRGLQGQLRGMASQSLVSQRAMLWGGGDGGTWYNPTAGSLWGLENQQRAMSYQQTMAGFGYAQQRMQVQNTFGIQQEAISGQRMGVTQGMQTWQLGFQGMQMQQAQAWGREDWQYQDQMRSLQQGWGMEDINEAIRMSSGRQRRQLVTQRERMDITQNLEGEQIDTQRERQEQLWAQQEEQYNKQVQYANDLMALDQQQYDLNVTQRQTYYDMETEHLEQQQKDYQDNFDLQEQIIEKQREYQAQQMEQQELQIEIQNEIAEKQEKINALSQSFQESWSSVMGSWAEMASFERASVISNAIKNMAGELNEMDVWKIVQLQGLFSIINNTSVDPSILEPHGK